MVRLDQCLFGYDDGHRLLASSLPLGDQASSLAELSDLAPGTVFGKSDGYWTGVPVPELRRYTLMRTWPAPEMPRPGCVWTHAVLLDLCLLEQLKDATALQRLFTRPQSLSDVDRYRQQLVAGQDLLGEMPPSEPTREAGTHVVRALLAALYGGLALPLAITKPGEADEATFAVWSQQWPRLRRNFRFQTAATREAASVSKTRFDFAVELSSADPIAAEAASGAEWLDAATADIDRGASGNLRSFLWSYGKDVRRQRGSFKPLVEIKLLEADAVTDAGQRLLDLIGRHFPEVDDGRTLKQDIVDGIVVRDAQLDVLRYILIEDGDAAFPPPSQSGVAKLTELWPNKPAELLSLAESTARADGGLGRAVFETITSSVPIEDFWVLTASFARVRESMISARPELLMLEGAFSLPDAELARYIGLIPPNATVAIEIVSQLTSRNDASLAASALERFGRAAARQVVSAAAVDRAGVGEAWVRALVARPDLLLQTVVLERAAKTSVLYELAEGLGWLTSDVIAGGAEPWIAGLVNVHSDLPDERRDTLRAFLVALGLAVGGDGGRRLLEKFFDMVHHQILKSRLPWRARDILLPLLPDGGWLSGWDIGLRLRLAVAACYISNAYSPDSFAALSSDKRTRELLGEAAHETRGGKRHARAVSR